MSDPRIGTQIAGYRIEEMVGRGGMGVVYRAEQIELGRKVALKLLAPELAESESFQARFKRESRSAAAIDHPNIIPLHEAGEADGLLFISMRYVEGLDLKALLRERGPLAPEAAIAIVSQVASALDAAHARGLVHRDVKPANVLVASGAGPESSDHCYLTDFGLTKDTSISGGLTATGQFVGTLDYVAPEQIEGKALDGRTDIYALGCVLYECLAGTPPFRKESEVALMFAHLNEDPPSLRESRPELPEALDGVIARAMARDPAGRYATCGEMMRAARSALAGAAVPEERQAAAPTKLAGQPEPAPAPGAAGVSQAPTGTAEGASQAPTTAQSGLAAQPPARRLTPALAGMLAVAAAVVAAVALAAAGVFSGEDRPAGSSLDRTAPERERGEPEPRQPRTPLIREAEVRAVVDSYATAYSNEDVGALADLVSRGFTRTNNGVSKARQAALAEVQGQFDRLQAPLNYRVSGLAVTRRGERTATAEGDYSITAANLPETSRGRIRWHMVQSSRGLLIDRVVITTF